MERSMGYARRGGTLMKKHAKKMVAPIVITVLLALYCIGFALTFLRVREMPLLVKLVGGIVPLLLLGVSVYVLVERIKEIRSGEEDDLSQY